MAQCFDDEADMNWGSYELDHLLQGAGAMLIQCDPDHVLGRVLNQHSSLVVVAILKELLAQIIAKRIYHKLDDVGVRLHPNHVNLVRITILKLLLKISAAMLILAELVDSTAHLLQRKVYITIHGFKAS
jgi:hypothetical protein